MDYSNIQTITSSIFIIIIYAIFMWLYINNSTDENKVIVYGMFMCYILGYIYLTYLNRTGEIGTLKLDPFKDLIEEIKNGKFPYETLLNVLLFVPVGMTLPLLSRQKMDCRNTAIAAAGLSLFTELLQLAAKRGWFETKDLWTNTVGAVLGYFFFVKVLDR